jgi:HPr kinase/phosphorylase
MYDRFGLEEQTYNILGLDVPSITVPVRPGRSIPIILEIAAMNHRQKKMGYNTAAEIEKKLLEQFGENDEQ